jgi:hypothetical protein
MRFQVPQFIEVEDKIFGPFTFKQFLYLAGGAGMIAIFFTLLPRVLAFIVAIPIVALSLALTFYKINNRPFISVLESYFKYITARKLFIWKMEARGTKQISMENGQPGKQIVLPKLSQSKLRDLTWDLSVKGGGKAIDAETPRFSERLSGGELLLGNKGKSE